MRTSHFVGGLIFLLIPVLSFGSIDSLEFVPPSLTMSKFQPFLFGCEEEAVVRPDDTAHLKQVIQSTPKGCTIRISGNYIVRAPLKVNHKLVSSPASGWDEDWFAPDFFIISEQLDARYQVVLEPFEDNDSFLFPGIPHQRPGALISPASDYLFSNLIILGSQGSLEHIGLNNNALPLTEHHCITTGLELDNLLPRSIKLVSLSTILNLCLPAPDTDRLAVLPNIAFSEPEETENSDSASGTSNTAKNPSEGERRSEPSMNSVTIPGRLSTQSSDRDDDEDDPHRQREVPRSHYSDYIDWEQRLRVIQSSTASAEKRKAYEQQYQRTGTYQKIGTIFCLAGLVAGSFLGRRYGLRGTLNAPWSTPDQVRSRARRLTKEITWPLSLGLISGLIAQGPLVALITISKRQYIRERLQALDTEE